MNARRVVEHIPATPHFDFLYGRYRLSSWVIPYFSTTMSLRDAATSLRLAADFPGSDDVAWKLDELYQREVDWPRVERRIVPYLRAAGQPQFFNALTIALLPTGHSLSGTEHAFAEDRDWRPPRLTEADRFPKTLRVGPITCGYWTAWDDFAQAEARTGQICWNPEQVFAVALDGQHRLAAIKQFVEHPGISDHQLGATSVPVILSPSTRASDTRRRYPSLWWMYYASSSSTSTNMQRSRQEPDRSCWMTPILPPSASAR